MKNHLGERTFATYQGWRRAIKSICPKAVFDGDADICQALEPENPTETCRQCGAVFVPTNIDCPVCSTHILRGIGEWDGETGCIYEGKGIAP